MTVIAWDGETLAADTLSTIDCTSHLYGPKIWRTPGGLFGGAGDDPAIDLVLAWLKRGGKHKNKPNFAADTDFEGLLITPNGDLWFIDKNVVPVKYHAQKYAIGSGGQAAIALMAVGKTAPEAVQTIIDKNLTSGVGGSVETLTLGRKKAIRKSS